MPLTVTSLKGKIIAKLNREIQPTGTTAFDKIATAIAEAVIEEITTNAVVSVEVSTAGSATAQTGSGTGTIS
jgi:hypothetical protein